MSSPSAGPRNSLPVTDEHEATSGREAGYTMKRREFVTASAATVGGSLLGMDAMAETLATRRASSSNEINVGVIGAGSRGKYMMRLFLRIPGVKVTALCDVYEPRFAEGREIAGEDTPVYRDYRQMLDSASDLDAVIVASPLSLHGEHVVASLERGLHVYGEKAMGFTVADCQRHRPGDAGERAPVPDRTAIPLRTLVPRGDRSYPERRDRTCDARLRILASQLQLAAAGARPVTRAAHQLETVQRILGRTPRGTRLASDRRRELDL